MISTRNRRDDVLRAVESCLAQNYRPLEVLVYDDASTDGTSEAVQGHFPEVKLHTSPEQVGYLVWRNQGFRDAIGEFVVSIDDDSYFTDPRTIDRVVDLFGRFPRAGAIALPYFEPVCERSNGRMPPRSVGTPLRHYIGCAHALRRELVLEIGGYPELLIHQGEERDLCLRMLDRGWETIYGDTPPLVHCYSPSRDRQRVNYFGYRNTLLFSGMHVPQPYVIPRLLIDSLQLFKYRLTLSSVPDKLRCISAGWVACARQWRDRTVVDSSTYRRYRSLPCHGPLETMDQELPKPLKSEGSVACSKV
ncbi:MAG: glycosyltransferase [Planctomycetaceae bacterium]|nr:glycosyltransferase [Planctomycetaceae bacterium]